MIHKSLVIKLFDGFTMQRWNDQLRPMELVEIDKQAHKMSLAYFLAKAVEKEEKIDFVHLIELGLFEYFERIVITDIKPPVFYKIKANEERYRALRAFVKNSMLPYLEGLPQDFIDRFCAWCDDIEPKDSLEEKILTLAHIDASTWEYELLHTANPHGYGMEDIRRDMESFHSKHMVVRRHLIQKLETRDQRMASKDNLYDDEDYSSYTQLVKMFGQMRFQVRWAQLHRVPKTSVLGHSYYVAMMTYLFSLSIANVCSKRLTNNFFTGLFHDLPEVFTRDIISPLKTNIPGLGDLIKEIEEEELEHKFKKLVPAPIAEELFYFIKDEFADCTFEDGEIKFHKEGLTADHNKNELSPRDGALVRFADQMAAFIEADTALRNGATASDFITAKGRIVEKYSDKEVAGLTFKSLFLDFR